jgi:ATP-dependent protease ClpP protease subunit
MPPGDDQAAPATPPPALAKPQLTMLGDIEIAAVERFLCRIGEVAEDEGDLVLELTTMGGDAEMARRIVLEIEQVKARRKSRFLFLGKTVVYSAGITIMSAFPRADRWLSRDAMLMIHGRMLEKTLALSGPMRANLAQIDALHAEIKNGLRLEEAGFRRLIEGSDVGYDELCREAAHSWYLTAEEAVERRLVAGIYPAPAAG